MLFANYNWHRPRPAAGTFDADALRRELAYARERLAHYGAGTRTVRPGGGGESITGETAEMKARYRPMLRDPVVKSAWLSSVEAVASLDLQVTPGGESEREQEQADFIRYNIERCKGGVRGNVESVLGGALLDGFSVCEPKTWPCVRGRWRGKQTLQTFKAKDTDTIQLELDPFRNLVGIKPLRNNAGRTFDPAGFVVCSYLSLFSSPLGMSDFRAADRYVELKIAALKLWMIALDKFSGPYLVGKTIEDRRAALGVALQDARASGFITLLPEDAVEVVNLALGSPAEFHAGIDYFDKQIAIALSGAHLQILEGQVPNAAGDTKVHRSTAELRQWMLASLWADAINSQLVPGLIDLNYQRDDRLDYPAVALGGVNQSDLLQEMQVAKAGQDLGMKLSAKSLFKRSRLDEAEDEADALVPPQAAPAPGGFGFADNGRPRGNSPMRHRFEYDGGGRVVGVISAPESNGSVAAFAEAQVGSTPLAGPDVAARKAADEWNRLEAAGRTVPNLELERVGALLEGTGWAVFWDESAGRWSAAPVDQIPEGGGA